MNGYVKAWLGLVAICLLLVGVGWKIAQIPSSCATLCWFAPTVVEALQVWAAAALLLLVGSGVIAAIAARRGSAR